MAEAYLTRRGTTKLRSKYVFPHIVLLSQEDNYSYIVTGKLHSKLHSNNCLNRSLLHPRSLLSSEVGEPQWNVTSVGHILTSCIHIAAIMADSIPLNPVRKNSKKIAYYNAASSTRYEAFLFPSVAYMSLKQCGLLGAIDAFVFCVQRLHWALSLAW